MTVSLTLPECALLPRLLPRFPHLLNELLLCITLDIRCLVTLCIVRNRRLFPFLCWTRCPASGTSDSWSLADCSLFLLQPLGRGCELLGFCCFAERLGEYIMFLITGFRVDKRLRHSEHRGKRGANQVSIVEGVNVQEIPVEVGVYPAIILDSRYLSLLFAKPLSGCRAPPTRTIVLCIEYE